MSDSSSSEAKPQAITKESSQIPADEFDDGTQVPAEIVQDLLPLIPEENRRTALTIMRRAQLQYSGPVPISTEMARYKEIDPSFPERFMRMAEKQVDHRHAMEKAVFADEFRLKRTGQNYALISLFALALLAALIAYMGDTKAAAAVASVAIVGIVGVFVTGRLIEKQSDEESGATSEAEQIEDRSAK